MNDTDFASCADDNAPYVSVYTIYEVIKRLEIASVKFTEMVCRWLKKPVVNVLSRHTIHDCRQKAYYYECLFQLTI